MKIEQSFTVGSSVDVVWAYLQDIPTVAECLPGATLTEDRGGGTYAGTVTAKVGPFGATFEGEATVTANAVARAGRVEGKGIDKRGGSRSRMTLDYRLEAEGETTRVMVEADVVLSGAIAQWGRTGLIQETANVLMRDFVACLDQRLAAASSTDAARASAGEVRGLAVLFAVLVAWLRRLFSGNTS